MLAKSVGVDGIKNADKAVGIDGIKTLTKLAGADKDHRHPPPINRCAEFVRPSFDRRLSLGSSSHLSHQDGAP